MANAYEEEREQILRAFGKNVRRLREKAGLSQEEFSERSRMHRTSIGYVEQARREPNLSTLMILATTLEVTIDELLEGIPVPEERRPRRGPKRSKRK